jgi:hypothetical protein
VPITRRVTIELPKGAKVIIRRKVWTVPKPGRVTLPPKSVVTMPPEQAKPAEPGKVKALSAEHLKYLVPFMMLAGVMA